MHVPDAVISLAVAPKDKHRRRPTSPRRSTASPRKTRPSACTATRSRRRPSSAAWASSTSTSTSSACAASTTARSSPASRRSPTARRSPSAASSTTPTRSRPVARASTRKVGGLHRAAARRRGRDLRVRRRHHRRLDSARVHPRLRQGLQGGDQEGLADRLPDRRRARASINDGASPRGRLVASMAFKTAAHHGLPRGATTAAKPTILEPIMKVEVQAPEEFQGSVMGQLNQRRGAILSTENARGLRASRWPRCR